MKLTRKLITLLLVLILVFTMFPAVHATDSQYTSVYLRQLICYYMHYRDNAQTDITRLLAELSEIDEAQGAAWEKIMDFWSYANSGMDIPTDVLPDGLPEDDSMCIVVLGYALGPYGGIKPELTGRLEVALESAEKYPNAYILCTGGATASRTNSKTEAGQMAAWLKKHGIAEERIIVEDQAYSTLENAKYGCGILSEEYPQVEHLALISSDYHVPRGCVYFYTQSVFSAYKSGTAELDIIACAAHKTTRKDEEGISSQAQGIGQITGVNLYGADKPILSSLEKIEVDGETTYNAGSAMELTVTASYNTGFSRDVTSAAIFSGVDMAQPGEQLLAVTYTENEITASAKLLIDVVGTPAPQIAEPTEPAKTAQMPALPTSSSGEPAPLWPFVLLAVLLALLAFLIRLKISRR